jgi:hypothetical protein
LTVDPAESLETIDKCSRPRSPHGRSYSQKSYDWELPWYGNAVLLRAR